LGKKSNIVKRKRISIQTQTLTSGLYFSIWLQKCPSPPRMNVTNKRISKTLKKGKWLDEIVISSKTRKLAVIAIIDRYCHRFLHLKR
jgi:hypothetical protein